MSRSFNTGGPCDPSTHYMIEPLSRLPAQLPGLLEQRAYFVLHAPRQTGKTTSLKAFAQKLTEEGTYAAALLTMQPGAQVLGTPASAFQSILKGWRAAALEQLPPELLPPPWPEVPAEASIGSALSSWARACPRPLVLFLDELDSLEGPPLRSVLHQIRASHPFRPQGFPACLALVGLRDLQDYKFYAGSEHAPRSAPSPFNIIVRSLTLQNFSRAEVETLYQQHTAETGQVFLPETIDMVFGLTQGQPWLVNALADILITDLVPDRTTALTPAHLQHAKDLLLQRRDAHLRTLADRLTDPRIRPILEPVLSGQPLMRFDEDDLRYAFDLGLLRRGEGGILEISNPIYHSTLLNALMRAPREAVPYLTSPTWMKDGKLELQRLLDSFLEFWRQHGSALLATVDYPELAPHLVILAFMQRVVNGGGKVEREVAVERGRMDVLVQHGDLKLALELKVWRAHQKDPLEEGLHQLDRYMVHLGTTHGWLFIFDRRVGQAQHGLNQQGLTQQGLTQQGLTQQGLTQQGLTQLIERLHVETVTSPRGFEITVLRS